MSKKTILIILFLLIIIYPLFSVFELEQLNPGNETVEKFQQVLNGLKISIWISWVFMVSLSIYYKWKLGKNLFFRLIYVFLLVFFILYGYYFQEMITVYKVQTPFTDDYTLTVIEVLRNLVVSGILTAFLQVAVWWFTRKWHRR